MGGPACAGDREGVEVITIKEKLCCVIFSFEYCKYTIRGKPYYEWNDGHNKTITPFIASEHNTYCKNNCHARTIQCKIAVYF